MIERFYIRGEGHNPLSNFSKHPIQTADGLWWMTVEHYYQAMKTLDPLEREGIRLASNAKEAKRLGRKCTLREDWEAIKIPVMRQALALKFGKSGAAQTYLLDTGDQLLVEGNDWGDEFWGVCDGKGHNWLGHLLMALRAELRAT